MKAWYFAPPKNRLKYRDNRLIQVGITHTVEGAPKTCNHGLHASERIIDALQYAETSILYRVELSGEMDIANDKIAAQSRTYLKRYDVEKILRQFARDQALINIEKIKPYISDSDYELIISWITTGDRKYQSAAESAAWSAESAAWSAESAAWSAANDQLTKMIEELNNE